jgi:hypothetical protein
VAPAGKPEKDRFTVPENAPIDVPITPQLKVAPGAPEEGVRLNARLKSAGTLVNWLVENVGVWKGGKKA